MLVGERVLGLRSPSFSSKQENCFYDQGKKKIIENQYLSHSPL